MSNYFSGVKRAKTNWLTMLVVKLFGKKYSMYDEEGTVIFYEFRKVYYVTKILERDEHENI